MPEILVEFVPDFSKLETGVDQLVSKGTISKEMAALFNDAGKSIDAFAAKFAKLGEPAQRALKPAIDAAKKSIKDLSTSGIKDLGELKKRVDGITTSFADGLGEGVEEALKEAGILMEEFKNALKGAETTSQSLKSELREMTEALAQMKLRGEENSQQYIELSARAAQYRDAIQDVTTEINKSASDTRKLDTAIEFVSGLAGAFAVLQGAMALAGEDSEEFQKTLLKVNAAMSILAGLQQIQNLLQKESNIIRAVTNTQQKLQVAITALDTAATSKNVIVKGAATIAQRALNAAMAANPALILITAFAALAGAITYFTGESKKAVDETEKLNNELERTNTIIDRNIEKIKEEGDLRLAAAKARGDSEEELAKLELQTIATTADAIRKGIDDNTDKFRKTLKEMSSGLASLAAPNLGLTFDEFNRLATQGLNNVDETLEVLNKIKAVRVTDAFQGFSQSSKDANTAAETLLNNLLAFQRQEESGANDAAKRREQQTEDERKERERRQKEADEKAKAAREKRLKDEADARRRELEDILAQEKAKLLIQKEGSPGELQAKKDVAAAELALALDNDKLTFNQRRLLLQEFFKTQRTLTEQFNAENKKRIVEDQISVIQTQLNALNLSNEERTRLLIEQLEIEKQIQLDAVINNETKRAEITAKFDKEIFETRKKAREEAFAQELADIEAANHQRVVLAQRDAADESLPTNTRLEALKDELDFEIDIINKKRFENQKLLKDKQISIEEYNRRAQELSNQEFDAKSKNEKAYTEIVQTESEKRLDKLKKTVGDIAEVANTIIDSLRTFNDSMNANEDARIEAQRDSLQRLRDLNAITEKEFVAKTKVIDRLERQTKQKQAEREKALALFQALINGAAAIVEAAPDPFKIVATSILVAAQIAAIVARPVPKFGKGTKKAPEGFAQVGETGTELIHTEKGYYVAEHPQIVWFKGGEKVYNPKETKEIFKEKYYNTNFELVRTETLQTPKANMSIVNNSNGVSHETKIDIDKMAKKIGQEIAKHPRLINNIDADGYSLFIQEGLNKSKYLNKRFTFK